MTEKNTLENIVKVAKGIFTSAALSDAKIEQTDSGLVVNSYWSTLDLEKNERTKFQRTFLFDSDAKLVHGGKPLPIRNNLWEVKSPNGELNAVVTNWKENGEDRQSLEIWRNDARIENINLSKLDKHGSVYEKIDSIGSLTWSSDSTKIAYLAETKKATKEKSFFTAKSGGSDAKPQEEKNKSEQPWLNEFVDDWGEQLVGKSKSVLVVYDLNKSEFNVIDESLLPKDFFVARAVWYENKGLLLSAYYTKPYKLGLIYCPVRKSELFYLDLIENTLTQVTNFNDCVRDARFSPDNEYICWLQNSARMPHFQTVKLSIMKWSTKKIETLIDIVEDPKDDQFPGLFASTLPKNCWSSDSKRILLNTIWRSENTIIVVDIESKKVTRLNNLLPSLISLQAIEFDKDWICASIQSYTQKSSLIIAKLPPRGQESQIKWTQTSGENNELGKLVEVELIKFKPTAVNSAYPDLDFEAVFIRSKVGQNQNLILFPHGGPHSAFTCDFSYHVACFYSLGYSVLLVNYRGSTGFGQNSIESLPGFISDYDVKDCQQAAEFVKLKYDFKRVFLYGGSHGGFLTLSLIGQYPEYYSVASVRNPVCDLNTMLNITDIPDWVECEAFGSNEFDPKKNITADLYSKLTSKSPIAHIDKVKTPTLFMIGAVDLRVPPFQSIEYYKALLSRNVPAKLLVYKEDSHPLDKPHTLADTVVHTIVWYEKHIY